MQDRSKLSEGFPMLFSSESAMSIENEEQRNRKNIFEQEFSGNINGSMDVTTDNNMLDVLTGI